jgi:hypothetical protein
VEHSARWIGVKKVGTRLVQCGMRRDQVRHGTEQLQLLSAECYCWLLLKRKEKTDRGEKKRKEEQGEKIKDKERRQREKEK